MRFSLTIISALAAFATANPAAIRERAVSENVDALEPISVQFANLRLFQDPSFKGAELVLFGDNNLCGTLFGEWNDRVSSAANDGGTTCVLYNDPNCTGRTVTLPPRSQIPSLPTGWDDQATTYRCT